MLQTGVDGYLVFLASTDQDGNGKNANTIIAYRNDIQQLCLHLERQGIQEWSQVTHLDIENYLLAISSGIYRATTIARKFAALKSFFRYLSEMGMLPQNPMLTLVPPHVEKNLPHVIEKEEVERLFAQVKRDTVTGQRDWIMLRLLVETRARVSELVSLDVEDLLRAQGTLWCPGTSRPAARRRQIVLSPVAVDELVQYIDGVRPRLIRNTEETALFVNHHGERLTRQGFWLIIKRYAREAGVEEITPYMLRHSYAMLMLTRRIETHPMQHLPGHAHLSTAQVYNHVIELYQKKE